MTRHMPADAPAIFRAVVEADFHARVGIPPRVLGPYFRLQDARAAVTRETHDWNGRPKPGYSGRIESTATSWKPV